MRLEKSSTSIIQRHDLVIQPICYSISALHDVIGVLLSLLCKREGILFAIQVWQALRILPCSRLMHLLSVVELVEGALWQRRQAKSSAMMDPAQIPKCHSILFQATVAAKVYGG